MNISSEKFENLTGLIKITVEKSDYQEVVAQKLKEYRKTANMPGFRAGKVPAGVIKKMYGKAVLADEVNKLLSQKLMTYIFEEKLSILGEPLPNDEFTPVFDWDKDEEFTFAFDIALTPEFSISIDKRNKLPFYNIEVEEDTVKAQVENHANRFGQNTPADVVEAKDSLKGTFVQVDENNNPVEGGITAEGVLIAIDLIQDEEIKAGFVGKEVNYTTTINPVEAFKNDHEVAHMLKIEVANIADANTTFTYTVTDILRFSAHPIDEDLFTKVLGAETEVKTLEDFNASVKKDIENTFAMSSEYKFGIDSKELLTKKAKFDLPTEFLKRWIVATNENITEEQVEKDWALYEEDLKWTLIKGQVAKANEIKVEEQDVKDCAKQFALMQFKQYGMFNITDEQLDQYGDTILADEKEKQRLSEKALEDKIYKTIKEKVNIDEISITQKAFDDLFEK